uniref:Uncharacterized protein n=1 Tax=Meloidogyne javanica TaxID=6303 RepID=A0A915MZG4_MELJA
MTNYGFNFLLILNNQIKKDKVDGLKLEDGQMTVNYDEDIMEEDNILENMKLIGKITPLINYGNYEFYIDKDGIMREKE